MSVSCVSDSSDCVCPPAVDLCHLVLYTWCSYCRKASPTHSQWSRLCWSATTSDIIWNNFLFHPSHFYHIALYICFMKWSLSCLVLSILCDPVDCSLPGSPVHGILQARILEWVTISFSRVSFPPRNWTWISCIAGRFFTDWTTGLKDFDHYLASMGTAA